MDKEELVMQQCIFCGYQEKQPEHIKACSTCNQVLLKLSNEQLLKLCLTASKELYAETVNYLKAYFKMKEENDGH